MKSAERLSPNLSVRQSSLAKPRMKAKKALALDRSIPELVVEEGLLTADQVAALLRPESLVSPRALLSMHDAVGPEAVRM